jgi:hypothetical protein
VETCHFDTVSVPSSYFPLYSFGSGFGSGSGSSSLHNFKKILILKFFFTQISIVTVQKQVYLLFSYSDSFKMYKTCF